MRANDHGAAAPFRFGPITFTCAASKAFWDLHRPVVAAWIAEMRADGDPWWQSAEHAAYCLVSHRELESERSVRPPHWRVLDVEDFLFHDLHEGGTVTFFGSVPIFFDQLVEALERFLAAGIIEPKRGGLWLEEMRASRERFLEYYSE